MSYCLNPNCPKPQNPEETNFCITCGTKLLLDNRYRATDFLAAGGMGRNFLAVDERTPSKKRCVIKQFCPDPDTVSNPAAFQKAWNCLTGKRRSWINSAIGPTTFPACWHIWSK